MNDIRRSILWVIFGFSLILLWDQWQQYQGTPKTFFPDRPAATASAPAPWVPDSLFEASGMTRIWSFEFQEDSKGSYWAPT